MGCFAEAAKMLSSCSPMMDGDGGGVRVQNTKDVIAADGSTDGQKSGQKRTESEQRERFKL